MTKKGVIFFVSLFIVVACNNKPGTSFKASMRDAYDATSKLFNLVWSPDEFKDEKNKETIEGLLERLVEDFHKVDASADKENLDPGFEVLLITQQSLLNDIKSNFKKGNVDYANWRLRGITTNCISCHSRYEVPTNSVGLETESTSSSETSSFEYQLARAEFLLATRQFDRATTELYTLAKTMSRIESGAPYAIKALKLWLIIEVRIKNNLDNTAVELEHFLDQANISPDQRNTVESWISDINAVQNMNLSETPAFSDAKDLLKMVATDSSVNDEKNLVSTLKATQILHTFLTQDSKPDLRRRAMYFLSLAYRHTPITSFEIYREMYLEQLIREFPETDEARKAFVMYKDYIETVNTGSGGIHLESEQEEKIAELKKIAFGSSIYEEGKLKEESYW